MTNTLPKSIFWAKLCRHAWVLGEVSCGGNPVTHYWKVAYTGVQALTDVLQVRAWLEETYPGASSCILSYHIGQDGLIFSSHEPALPKPVANEVRLRMDGLFEMQKQASKFIQEFEALYTNGPAGGGGIRFSQSRTFRFLNIYKSSVHVLNYSFVMDVLASLCYMV